MRSPGRHRCGGIGGARSGAAVVLAVCLLVLGAPPARAAAPQRLGPKQEGRIPERIVTLAPSLTSTVLALGRGAALVGVSRFDEQPEVTTLPRVGGLVDPSVEAIVGLRPDLVLLPPAPGNQRPVELLVSMGIPVLILPMNTIDETGQSMLAVGVAVGRPRQAQALVDSLTATRQRIRAQTRWRKAPRVLFIVGYEPLVVAGPGSFAHELLLDAGGTNAAERARSAWVVYPLERAVASRPDVIVDAAYASGGRDKVKALPGLSEARWVKPSSDALLQPGPSLERGLEELAILLHGPPKAEGRPTPSRPEEGPGKRQAPGSMEPGGSGADVPEGGRSAMPEAATPRRERGRAASRTDAGHGSTR